MKEIDDLVEFLKSDNNLIEFFRVNCSDAFKKELEYLYYNDRIYSEAIDCVEKGNLNYKDAFNLVCLAYFCKLEPLLNKMENRI